MLSSPAVSLRTFGCMQGVLIALLGQTFQAPAIVDKADRLAIHRFLQLKSNLEELVVRHILSERTEEEGFGEYVEHTLAAVLAAKWHVTGKQHKARLSLISPQTCDVESSCQALVVRRVGVH